MLAAAAMLAACTGNGPDRPEPSGASAVPPPASGAVTGTGTDLIPPDTGTSGSEGTETVRSTTGATSASKGPPDAVQLPWLAGPTPKDGILLGAAGSRLWQGPRAGERAVLGDGWYRYFGPGGSLVGCTTSGSCVGVGADGSVAVTSAPQSPREVYRSDGTYVGRYSDDGDKMSPESDPPALRDALAATGVDVAGLVNAATRTAPFAGGITGDPHLITAGGERFTTQVIGQYVARSGDPSHEIQVQFDPMSHRDDVSVASIVVIGTGSNSVVVDASGVVSIDGRALARPTEFEEVSLEGGAVVGWWPSDSDGVSATAVLWPDGSSVVVTANAALGLTLVAHLYPVAGFGGLFGTAGGSVGQDLLARGGASATAADAVRSWTVTSSERLLPTPAGTASAFPTKTATIDPGAAKVARAACSASGLQNAADIGACSFDVGLTGDTGFVPGHVELGTAAEAPTVARAFAARWPALEESSDTKARELPANGQLDTTVAAAQSSSFEFTVTTPGPVRIVNRSGCGENANPPPMDQAALRVFDTTGHPVSDRVALCGHVETPALPAGKYVLTVANGIGQADTVVRSSVTLP